MWVENEAPTKDTLEKGRTWPCQYRSARRETLPGRFWSLTLREPHPPAMS